MPQSEEAVPFEMSSRHGSQPRRVDAVLTVQHALSQHASPLPGWKAAIRVADGKQTKRLFGCWRPTLVETADALLKQHAQRIDGAEMERVVQVVKAMQSRRSSRLQTSTHGPQPSVALSTKEFRAREPAIQYIHQIYGLFGDAAPMSPLFQTSQRKWMEVADQSGAAYMLWTADDLESLMKQRYHQYWDMYCNVRYPIMRCDIGRLAIIHSYGGLYSDLDVVPNRSWYPQVELALPRVRGKLAKIRKAPSAKTSQRGSEWKE